MQIYRRWKRGWRTIEYEYPWITPGSIEHLEKTLTPDLDVIEFGAGGSTLFFARRCRSVLSFEANQTWYDKVVKFRDKRKLSNIEIHLIKDRKEILPIINGRKFDVAMIDSDIDVQSRPEQLQQIKDGLFIKPRAMIIVDNYDVDYAGNPDSYLGEFSSVAFNEHRYQGKGTKIYTRGW